MKLVKILISLSFLVLFLLFLHAIFHPSIPRAEWDDYEKLTWRWVEQRALPCQDYECINTKITQSGISVADIGNVSMIAQRMKRSPFRFIRYKFPVRIDTTFGYSSSLVLGIKNIAQWVIKLPSQAYNLDQTRNISRVVEAERINRLAPKYKTRMRAPKKYLYPLPGHTDEVIDSNCAVIAEKITTDCADHLEYIPTQAFRDLCSLIMEAHFSDSKPNNNIVIDDEGVIVFIDTEAIARNRTMHPSYDFCTLKVPPLYELLLAYKLIEHPEKKAQLLGYNLSLDIMTLFFGIAPLKRIANTVDKKTIYYQCIQQLIEKIKAQIPIINRQYDALNDLIDNEYDHLSVVTLITFTEEAEEISIGAYDNCFRDCWQFEEDDDDAEDLN